MLGETDIEESELKEYLKGVLPNYMIPTALVKVDLMPLTANGKVDRKALSKIGFHRQNTKALRAPQDNIEQALLKMWSEILNVAEIDTRDNFFRMGGHSLKAIQVVTRVQQELHCDLSLVELFSNPTIEDLSKVIKSNFKSNQLSPLVKIQAGDSNKQPFFVIHHRNGDVISYVDMAKGLGKDQPVYGIRSLGMVEEVPPLVTIEEMAQYYISLIKQVQLVGPYMIGGWSMGGVIAYEVARQLSHIGEHTNLLVIFDTRAHFTGIPDEVVDDVTFWNYWALAHKWVPQLNLDFLATLNKTQQQDYISNVWKKAGDLPTTDTNLSDKDFLRMMGIIKSNQLAVWNYSPQQYNGKSYFVFAPKVNTAIAMI